MGRVRMLLLASLWPSPLLASNGMLQEGYGSHSLALGGATQGFDSGVFGLYGNPATLALAPGRSRIEAGTLRLGQDIAYRSVKDSHIRTSSDATSYWSPSIAYTSGAGNLTWGIGVLPLGGVGTQYGDDSALYRSGTALTFDCAPPFSAGHCTQTPKTPLSGREVKAELGVGALILPLGWRVGERLTLGASLQWVWAMMDLRVDLSGLQFARMLDGVDGQVAGSMVQPLAESLAGRKLDYGRLDFSDEREVSGAARGSGWSGELGFTYLLNERLRLGASYRLQARLGDLEADRASLSMGIDGLDQGLAIEGDSRIEDFRWPASYAIGLAWQASERLLLVADLRWILWSEVLASFDTRFTAADGQPLAGRQLAMSFDQKWRDQRVLGLGLEYRYSERLRLRAGLNLADHPVHPQLITPISPAVVERHLTLGFGYRLDDHWDLNFAGSFGFSDRLGCDCPTEDPVEIEHDQVNWSLHLGYRW